MQWYQWLAIIAASALWALGDSPAQSSNVPEANFIRRAYHSCMCCRTLIRRLWTSLFESGANALDELLAAILAGQIALIDGGMIAHTLTNDGSSKVFQDQSTSCRTVFHDK